MKRALGVLIITIGVVVGMAAQTSQPIDKSTAAEAFYTIPGGTTYHRAGCPATWGHRLVEIAKSALTADNEPCPICHPNGYTCWGEQVSFSSGTVRAEKLYATLPPCPAGDGQPVKVMSNAAEPAAGNVDATIRAKCEKDWATDFRMQAACQTQQREAVSTLNGRAMNTSDLRTVRQKCLADWPSDFRMQNACELQQIEGLKQLGR